MPILFQSRNRESSNFNQLRFVIEPNKINQRFQSRNRESSNFNADKKRFGMMLDRIVSIS